MSETDGLLIRACEHGWIPDAVARAGIRRLCRERLLEEEAGGAEVQKQRLSERLRAWRSGPIALATHDANAQHYEVPAAFFEQVLGRHLKYSSALWPDGVRTLDEAEATMLALTCERAALRNGMRVLELGCGWGSLTLWMAQRYPASQIVAVSNSAPQREWIMARAAKRGLANVEVVTADINTFAPAGQFDRVVSVEMLEHVRNHAALFARIARWLRPEGRLFVHVFCHQHFAYAFESAGKSDWMARHFFSGGMMPSFDLFLNCQRDLKLEERWWMSGTHYRKTSDAWLDALDRNRRTITELFGRHYAPGSVQRAMQRWRMFFMAVSELFGLDDGRQWGLGHYLFGPR